MIATQTTGKSASALVRYLRDAKAGDLDEIRGQLIGGSLTAQTFPALLREIAAIGKLRPDLSGEDVVTHLMFSIPPGEHLNDRQWRRHARKTAQRLGFDNFAIIRHSDRPHEHVHLVLVGIQHNGARKRMPYRSFRVLEQLCREAEVEFGLKRLESPVSPADLQRNPYTRAKKSPARITRNERRMAERGADPEKKKITDTIDAAREKNHVGKSFFDFLKSNGVDVRLTRKQGRAAGIAYAIGDFRVRGSLLGTAYSGSNFFREFHLNEDSYGESRRMVGEGKSSERGLQRRNVEREGHEDGRGTCIHGGRDAMGSGPMGRPSRMGQVGQRRMGAGFAGSWKDELPPARGRALPAGAIGVERTLRRGGRDQTWFSFGGNWRGRPWADACRWFPVGPIDRPLDRRVRDILDRGALGDAFSNWRNGNTYAITGAMVWDRGSSLWNALPMASRGGGSCVRHILVVGTNELRILKNAVLETIREHLSFEGPAVNRPAMAIPDDRSVDLFSRAMAALSSPKALLAKDSGDFTPTA